MYIDLAGYISAEGFPPILSLFLLKSLTPSIVSLRVVLSPSHLGIDPRLTRHTSSKMISPPSSILIIGSGVFGLSTAHSLATNPTYSQTTITVIDRHRFPSPDGSSIDSSRIIRSDYSSPLYAELASKAQKAWRETELGEDERYSESGLLLTCEREKEGAEYVQKSYRNVREIFGEENVVECTSNEEVKRLAATGGGSGSYGYLNKASGWADAEAAMVFLRRKVEALNRVNLLVGTVTSLSYSSNLSTVTGATLSSGEVLTADLTILAAGAWTPTLLDLSGRAEATGQVIAYLRLSSSEQERLENIPVMLSFTSGMFIIPPRNNVLKVARHAYGYLNPVCIPHPDPEVRQSNPDAVLEVSVPMTSHNTPGLWIPKEGEEACRQCIREMVPWLSHRPFEHTRICWYSDTPEGDFLVDYHPQYKGLFLATGGSGHAFKFLPVIGEEVVGVLEGKVEKGGIRALWKWRDKKVEGGLLMQGDGSRSGTPGLVLDELLKKDERVAKL